MNEYESELWILDRFLELREYIQNLEAENERYKSLYEDLKSENLETIKAIKQTKSEAIKEFAERFKGIAGIYQKDTYVIGVDEFDNLLAEMESERE